MAVYINSMLNIARVLEMIDKVSKNDLNILQLMLREVLFSHNNLKIYLF
jgi:hypothetical protein